MDKKLYWVIQNNSSLLKVVENISDAEKIIMDNFSIESEGGLFEIQDLQYSINPEYLTISEFNEINI